LTRTPVPLVATADWGYLRLRREDFSDADLVTWAKRIREQPWGDAFVFMKHEEEGKGPKLAARLWPGLAWAVPLALTLFTLFYEKHWFVAA